MHTYPRICHDVGLDCETCTEGAARNLSKICKGLKGKMIGQLFVQIYTDPACAKMHVHFAEAYMAASEEVPRKMAASAERHRAIAAVA
jgi:hypothetical protein